MFENSVAAVREYSTMYYNSVYNASTMFDIKRKSLSTLWQWTEWIKENLKNILSLNLWHYQKFLKKYG